MAANDLHLCGDDYHVSTMSKERRGRTIIHAICTHGTRFIGPFKELNNPDANLEKLVQQRLHLLLPGGAKREEHARCGDEEVGGTEDRAVVSGVEVVTRLGMGGHM